MVELGATLMSLEEIKQEQAGHEQPSSSVTLPVMGTGAGAGSRGTGVGGSGFLKLLVLVIVLPSASNRSGDR